MTRPLPAKNRSPQTLALPGFVVFGIPKLRGLSPSDDSARSPRAQRYGHSALIFERVQITPADPGIDRPTTRSSARGLAHLNAFKWHVGPAAQSLPPHSTSSTARYLNAFKRQTTRCEHPSSAGSFERVQITRRRHSRSEAHRPRRHPILLIATGGPPMPPPK
jgi:hypothetical protein